MSNLRKPNRRGALLIVVLSILVLFALIALTFVVVAGVYNRSAKAAGRIGVTDDEGRQLVEQAFLQLLRGTTNTRSQILSYASGETDPTKMISQSLLEDLYGIDFIKGALTSAGDTATFPGFVILTSTSAPFTDKSDYYSGRVITMLDGPCALLSSRIVRFDASTDQLLVEAFENELGANVAPLINNTFIINGRAFGGIEGNPVAGVLGSPNEGYDAPDANNPFLGYIPTEVTDDPATLAAFPWRRIIPSFLDRFASGINVASNSIPNPNVDSDNDGILDSHWIDVDLPIKTSATGVRYKPFVAILCLDMDGRVNINAHGSLAQASTAPANFTTGVSSYWANATDLGSYTSDGMSAVMDIRPRGLGYGAADVNPTPVIGSTNFQPLLQERYKSRTPDTGNAARPGLVGLDMLNLLHNNGTPDVYASAPRGYGSQLDLHGVGMLGLDFRGQPMTYYTDGSQMTESPYEINLVQPNGADSPFTASDLESILRWRDVDAKSQSRRIASVAPSLLSDAVARRSLTTASFRIPVPATPEHILDRVARIMPYNAAKVSAMLPFELLHGTKMDINRPWGNNNDNSSNLVVDDPEELGTAETIMADVYSTAPSANFGNDTGVPSSQGRHLYARNLFCLMMFLMDNTGGSDPQIIYRTPLKGAPGGAWETLDDIPHRELTIRRIAQWAVNCVDFRDPDAIMTPFEYDINPFNGWDVDGIVDDGSGSISSDDGHTDRRLVWGCEYPDLIMTESLAFHDRRVRDTDWDDYDDEDEETDHPDDPLRGSKRIHKNYPTDDMEKGDKDLDQVRMPEGSTILEFYAARNSVDSAHNPVVPRELYDASGNLDLKRTVTASGGSVFPVWRVGITAPHHPATAANALSPESCHLYKPDTTTYQPEKMSVLIDNTDTLTIERWVWFINSLPVSGVHQELPENTFYNKDNRAGLMAPGTYAVVGPRRETFLGAKPISDEVADPLMDDGVTENADQKLDLASGGASGIDYTDLDGTSAYPIGPNVTPTQIEAPLTIYAVTDATNYPGGEDGLNISEPLPTATNAYPAPTHDREGVMDAYGDGTTPSYLDRPLDSRDDRPLQVDGLLDTGTTHNYKSAFLQRLANPLVGWHPLTNPYITVDWIPLDLTVFNGEDRAPEDWDTRMGINETKSEKFDTDDENPRAVHFGSRERWSDEGSTYWFYSPAATPFFAFGSPTGTPTESEKDDSADECFQYDLIRSLPDFTFFTMGDRTAFANSTLGYLPNCFHGSSFLTPIPGPTSDPPGQPTFNHFPWLTWLNRPFVNEYEMMLVPFTSQGEFLHQYSAFKFDNQTDPQFDSQLPYAHVLNFHHSKATHGGTAPHFYRLLEYIEAPSRFVGTQKWFNPTSAVGTYRAPYHRLSRFRDPGLVNINTIPGPAVWHAIAESQFTRYDPDYPAPPAVFPAVPGNDSQIRFSRNPVPSAPPYPADPRFTRPFRSGWINNDQSEVDRTVLRYSTSSLNPMMAYRWTSAEEHIDPTTSPYFFFQGLIRQAGLLTTQSNVYAIWITVGYFEVSEAGTPIRELGQDTGDVVRHRGFYVVDRSIPVAAERGKNHNVEKAVLLRRYIE